MVDSTSGQLPTQGYTPEWLQLEAASGGRYQMAGDFAVDVPTYNGLLTMLAGHWPRHEDELEIWDEKAPFGDVRIYKPRATGEITDSLPLIIYYHGGGFIAGTLDTEDPQCRHLAARYPALVISVDYPKVSDLTTKLDTIIQGYGIPSVPWSKVKAVELGVKEAKTLLWGGSAGAMLAIEVAYHYIVQGDTESVDGLVLPFTVAFPYTYGEDGEHKERFMAWKENGEAQVPIISRKLAEFIWSHYDADFKNPKHFPGLASDEELSKFPPTYIATAEKDCFRDDGSLLEWRLKQAGVPTELVHFPGLPHYFHIFPALSTAQTFMDVIIKGVKSLLMKPR